MATTLEHAHPPNTCQYQARTDRGDYLIQVAWPLCWGADRTPLENDAYPISSLYVMDGNAYFFTALDISRRLEFTNNARTVVVGIGYPPSKYVYDFRRGPDLTPPTADGTFDMPLDSEGKPRTDLSFGEADEFLNFVQNDVMTYVQKTLFPHLPLGTSRSALFGHSYGGIFTLNAMYTRPTLFGTFIAASPDIEWNKASMVREQEAAFRGRETPANPPPALVLTWGTGQQDLEKKSDESEESFEKRLACAESKTMRDSAKALAARLTDCPSVRSVSTWEFVGEDHGSAAVTGVQHGILKFLVDKI
ncbi:hypothetical protein G7Z17_g329 [Cylindrodendrum hubeiense]|uniref:Uncharacterized protein n=1 Tax=Cylindrodendrum hubeiense TaxID=595255 RepID=A0A9P5HLE9_9HYPO|nr:hypothetical protein G7Z17_g329 [Cylindrodendrum hubeiense]